MLPTGNLRFVDFANVASVVDPVDLADGANNGDWINMSEYHRCAFIVIAAAGTAANDLTVTMTQATTNTGTGEKALNFTEVFTKQGAALNAIGTFTKQTQSAGNTYTDGTNGEEQLIYVLDFAGEQLDIDNDFDHVQLTIAQVGAAKIGAVIAIPYGPKNAAEGGVSVL